MVFDGDMSGQTAMRHTAELVLPYVSLDKRIDFLTLPSELGPSDNVYFFAS